MTARELLLEQLATAEAQLTAATDGIDAQGAEARATPSSFSIREQIAHLAETCVALETDRRGDVYEWGSWTPADSNWPAVRDEWLEIRRRTVEATTEDDADLRRASGYLAEHDFYHVGSIVAARFTIEPDWDSGALYA